MSYLDELRALVKRRTGLEVHAATAPSLERFVEARAQACGLAGGSAYVSFLRTQAQDSPEFRQLLDAITNGETYFFRDGEQIEAIGALLQRCAEGLGRRLQIWSAGCSSGEEPYTLAIVARERGVEVEILGTDLNPAQIEAAERGLYGEWALRRMALPLVRRYFDFEMGMYRVRRSALGPLCFRCHNLVTEAPPRPSEGAWDLIVCRNVFIYYPPAARTRALNAFSRVLAPGGWLALGASESVHGLKHGFSPTLLGGRLFFQRARSEAPDLARLGLPAPEAAGLAGAAGLGGSGLGGGASLQGGAPDLETAGAAVPSGEVPAAGPKPGAVPGDVWRQAPLLDAILDQEDLAAALAAASRVRREVPEDPVAALLEGHLRLRAHLFAEALESYRAAQDLDALLPEPHLYEGLTLRKMGEFAQVEAALRRALFLEPGLWEAAWLLAGSHARLGRTDAARSAYRRTLALLEAPGARAALSTPAPIRAWFLPSPEQARQLCIAWLKEH